MRDNNLFYGKTCCRPENDLLIDHWCKEIKGFKDSSLALLDFIAYLEKGG